MTPDTALNPIEEPGIQPPSTAGMTTKVVKGSMWTLIGQIAPLAISFLTAPIVIRLLGAEGYGVLVLIGLIPAYFAFADLGMGIASTRFASRAYAEGSPAVEARLVRTAALIALIAATPVAAALVIFSSQLVTFLNVPGHLQSDASLALRFAAATFVITLLNGIFNTPQLTRLRMDLNTLVTVGFRIVGLIATPLVLFLGGSIAAVVFVLMVASLLALVGHLLVSRRLLRHLFELTIEPAAIRPMLRYGAALAGAGVAGVLLLNLEKLVLARTTSVETLAYYSVAFTLAMMMTTLSASMTQSLIPAFSQILAPEKRAQLNSLFSRAFRINIIVMLPVLAVLVVVARPFFTLWAGEDFGRDSTVPFYILLIGLAFAINNYVPMSLLLAAGKTDAIAKLYWGELLPYLALIAVLTYQFGARGAAAAWTLRIVIDTVLVSWISTTTAGVSYQLVGAKWQSLLLLFATLAPLIAVALLAGFSYWLLFVLPLFLAAYAALAWSRFLASEEKSWLIDRLGLVFGR